MAKIDRLREMIASRGSLIVAFSGGVDSGFLSKVAKDALGDGAVSVIVDSEFLPRSEMMYARRIASEMGLRLVVADFRPLDDEKIVQNPSERCYICKKGIALALRRVAREMEIECIADGANLSDFQDYRPGIRATDEAGIWHPFVDAGVTKADIRAAAREMGLPFWDRPASACLASRIPYGNRITRESLEMIEEAEDHLKGLGIQNVRVRAHGDVARIEVSEDDMPEVLRIKEEIARGVRSAGFRYVCLDIEGYRTGSMNEALNKMKPYPAGRSF